MLITDARTRVRYFKGGCIPKLYGGGFLQLYKEELEKDFADAKIGADQAL